MSTHEARVSHFKGTPFTYRSNKEYLQKYAECQRQWYRECLEKRICPDCELPLPDGFKRSRCNPCSDIINENKRKRLSKKK